MSLDFENTFTDYGLTDRKPSPSELREFEDYWTKKANQERSNYHGWTEIYTNELPPRDTLLREERIAWCGAIAIVAHNLKIIGRRTADRFVMMTMEYLQLDRPGLYDVLIIDVDCDFDIRLLAAAGLPIPRYYVGRRREIGDDESFVRRPHLVYWLRRPVKRRKDGKRTKADFYFEAIRKTLIQRLRDLGLTVDPKRPDLSKNPHHDAWDYIQGDYRDWSLGELRAALGELTTRLKPTAKDGKNSATKCAYSPASEMPAVEPDQHLLSGYSGRNEAIFHETRRVAYGMTRRLPDEIDLREWISAYAHRLNQEMFRQYWRGPLKNSEVDTIALSIADFVIHRYTGSLDGKDRGACRRENLIHPTMTKPEKQGVGGTYGAGKNAEKTRQKVAEAFETLMTSGTSPSVSAVAKTAGVSRPTARKWLAEISAAKAPEAVAKVEKTVPIRKVYSDNVRAGQVKGLGAVLRTRVTTRTTPIMDTGALAADQTWVQASNDSYRPLKTKAAAGLEVVYQHPLDANKALLEDGSTLSATDSRIRDLPRSIAPTRVLDLAGLLDDSPDEYAPPIGEMDVDGVIRFPEEIYALSRASASTWEWTDADVDRYCERMSA